MDISILKRHQIGNQETQTKSIDQIKDAGVTQAGSQFDQLESNVEQTGRPTAHKRNQPMTLQRYL